MLRVFVTCDWASAEKKIFLHKNDCSHKLIIRFLKPVLVIKHCKGFPYTLAHIYELCHNHFLLFSDSSRSHRININGIGNNRI